VVPVSARRTIVNAILRILAAKDVRLLLCAPTGRAAKRMKEATGLEAKTIHRLLEVDPKGGGFKRGEDNPLDCDGDGVGGLEADAADVAGQAIGVLGLQLLIV
jgi:ATP-dependent exoDNAse (exonuclease V) alpha subunit